MGHQQQRRRLTAADHIDLAEHLLASSAGLEPCPERTIAVATAQAHATLAVAISEAMQLAVKHDALEHWRATEPAGT